MANDMKKLSKGKSRVADELKQKKTKQVKKKSRMSLDPNWKQMNDDWYWKD